MNEIEFYIEKLLNYFNVTTISDLAEVMEIKQSSISSWKIRNSISAIRKNVENWEFTKRYLES